MEVKFLTWKGIFNFINKSTKENRYIPNSWLLTSGTVAPMTLCGRHERPVPQLSFLHMTEHTAAGQARASGAAGPSPALSKGGGVLD